MKALWIWCQFVLFALSKIVGILSKALLALSLLVLILLAAVKATEIVQADKAPCETRR